MTANRGNEDLLGAALGLTSSSSKSKLVSRVASKTSSTSHKVQLPSDGTFSGAVPIPKSRLGSTSTASNDDATPFLSAKTVDSASVLERQQRLRMQLIGQPGTPLDKPLGSIENVPAKRINVAGCGGDGKKKKGTLGQQVQVQKQESAFASAFGDSTIDLEKVKSATALGAGALEEFEQLRRTEKLKALDYKEGRQTELDKKKRKGEGRIRVRYFCDTCKDGVGRDFVFSKCKNGRHEIRTERVFVQTDEEKAKKTAKFNGRDGESMVLGTGIAWNGTSVKNWNDGGEREGGKGH